MSRARGPLRRVLAEPGTPYGRLALAGLLGLAAAAATIGLLAGSGYVVGRAALQPGLSALVGILAAVEVLAFLRGPLRYAERLVGHDAALRALTRWRLWLYDCLSPRVPAALAGWRSGDLLARAIDDVDALQDLYLRTLLPVAIATGAAAIGTVAVGLILPWAALALGIPLLVALTVPALLTWRRAGDAEVAALAGSLSAQVVDALAGAPELLAFGADAPFLHAVEDLGDRSDALERRHAHLGTGTTLLMQVCLGVAVTAVLAVGVSAVHAHHLGQVMVAVLPLAAFATFETVPGVPLAVARSLEVRAAAERLFALEDVPVPVVDPTHPSSSDARGARARLRRRRLALWPWTPPRPRRREPPRPVRRSCRRHGIERRRQVEPRHRALALLAARGRHLDARRHGRGAAAPSRCARRLCAGRPAGAALRRHGAIQPRPRPARRHRRGDRRRVGGGPSDGLGGRTPRRARDAGGRGRRDPVRRRAPTTGRGPRPAWRRARSWCSTSRPAGSTPRWPTKCSRACLPPLPRRAERPGHHPPGPRGGPLRRDGDARGRARGDLAALERPVCCASVVQSLSPATPHALIGAPAPLRWIRAYFASLQRPLDSPTDRKGNGVVGGFSAMAGRAGAAGGHDARATAVSERAPLDLAALVALEEPARDGRVARGQRTRRNVAEALMELLRAGETDPTAKAVALRAGVSLRLVFHHFADMDDLYQFVAALLLRRQWAEMPQLSPRLSLATRIERTVGHRAALFEETSEIRRALVCRAPTSPAVREALATADNLFLQDLKATFAAELADLPANVRAE